MNFYIRKIKEEEYPVLEDFLYEAIFVPKDTLPPPRDIIKKPELQVYLTGFGKNPGDYGLVAQVGDKIAGAVWVRIMNDYGHIDDNTPSFAISLYRQYRHFGIGTAMMREMLLLLKQEGYGQASLAVQKENYAVSMYQNVGFEIVDENSEEYIMLCRL